MRRLSLGAGPIASGLVVAAVGVGVGGEDLHFVAAWDKVMMLDRFDLLARRNPRRALKIAA